MTVPESQSLADPAEVRLAEGETPPESRGTGVWEDVRHAAGLIKKYFGADPLVGSALLGGILGIGAIGNYLSVNVQLTAASATSALAERKGDQIPTLIGTAMVTFAGIVLLQLVTQYLRYTLRIRSRGRLTALFLGKWLADERYYHLEQRSDVEHPEQRIQEDLFIFGEQVIAILPGIVGSLFPIFLYADKLWTLSPAVSLDAVGLPFVVHGWLVYLTVGFAIAWTFVTHWLGSGLTRAEITRQGLEAEFRQKMAALRENGEAVAFQRGGAIEGARITGTFDLIRKNWKQYTYANLRVDFATSAPTMLFLLVPVVMCAPFVLDGRMRVGDVQFVSSAMLMVYMSVGVLIQSYGSLAILRSAVSRLRYFDETLSGIDVKGEIDVRPSAQPAYVAHDLALRFPNGRQMIEIGGLTIAQGERVLIRGQSGAGKSTFLRAIAGLWPYGRGSVDLPETAKVHFIPQRSYMPDSTLATLMAYPKDPGGIPDETYRSLLGQLGLGALSGRLHEYASWKRILSPGEQQRIAAARAILDAPDFLFVDEATSALDLRSEATFYTLLGEQLPNAAIISVAHRPTVEEYHDRILNFTDGKASESSRARSKPAAT